MRFLKLLKFCAAATGAALFLAGAAAGQAAPVADDPLLNAAREAWRKRDRADLAVLSERAQSEQHPLAPWVDYWALFARLPAAQVADLQAFYRRWPGSYVEDRLRNDWLLELGRRQDWSAFAADYPSFRMDDDREVHCHAVVAEHQLGTGPLKPGGTAAEPFKVRALAVWLAQREATEPCTRLGELLSEGRKPVFGAAEHWAKLRSAVEANRLATFKQTAELTGRHQQTQLVRAFEDPTRYLLRVAKAGGRGDQEAAAVALVRLGASDTDRVEQLMRQTWSAALAPDLAQWVWAQTGRQAALRLEPDAAAQYQRALALGKAPTWSADTWAWGVRAALRANGGAGDWALAQRLLDAMPEPVRQSDPAWDYWRAQAQYRNAAEGPEGEPARRAARAALQAQVSPLNFYGQLAADELGLKWALPPTPAPLTEAERQAAAQHAGLSRALLLIRHGLRNEGVREWNFSLRDLGNDRALLAAAQRACDAEVWDRCINTSERTKTEVDLAQRYPTPFRQQVVSHAQAAGLHAADPFGLIRQESRFITDARSGPGASGLMQVMPATAKWTAKKIGLSDYHPKQIHDADTNLKIGMGYLRHVLAAFDGALPLAAAAYNAGPGRPTRWREGVSMDAAAWAETIPFTETRDYVKKVLTNATLYARLLGQPDAQLRQRLGQRIGPRAAGSPNPADTLP
ncbi:lytic transglycosylase domain-containing protein [Inhella crocodyli]|nr:lytic transglycosylase domain-containing protein [Inhella crocodyli]